MAFRIVLGHYVEALEAKMSAQGEDWRAWLQQGYRRERWRLLCFHLLKALLLGFFAGTCFISQLVLALVSVMLFVAILAVSLAANGLLNTLIGGGACVLMISFTLLICRALSIAQGKGFITSRNALHEYRRIKSAHLEAEDLKLLGDLLLDRRRLTRRV